MRDAALSADTHGGGSAMHMTGGRTSLTPRPALVRLLLLAVLAAAALGLQVVFHGGAGAVETFTVNSIGTDGDISAADNVCETNVIGQCTLSAAIMQANGDDQVDILASGEVDVNEDGAITAADDLANVKLALAAG